MTVYLEEKRKNSWGLWDTCGGSNRDGTKEMDDV